LALCAVRTDGQLVLRGDRLYCLPTDLAQTLRVGNARHFDEYRGTAEDLLVYAEQLLAVRAVEDAIARAEAEKRKAEDERARDQKREAMRAKIAAEGPAAGIYGYGYIDSAVPEDLRPSVVAEIQRRDAERQERERLAEEAKEQARQARHEHVMEHIRRHGTDEQRERLAEELLAYEAACASLRDHLFAPLDGQPLYQRLTASDVCPDECEASFATDDAEDATQEQFVALKRLRGLAPAGSTCTLRIHTGTCECRGHEAVTRAGVLIQITDGPITLSREYAI
jgi:hypothetical protein